MAQLTLNAAPIEFDGRLIVGSTPFAGDDEYRKLREDHRETHVFRLSASEGRIYNVGISSDPPLGKVVEDDPEHHLLLLGKTLQRLILSFLGGRFSVLKPSQPLVFWGGRQESRLLSTAAVRHGATPPEGLEVFVKYLLDTRVLALNEVATLCLISDVSTSHQIEIPLARLVADKVDIKGRWVCERRDDDGDPDEGLLPRLKVLGRVVRVEDGRVDLADSEVQSVQAADVFLEPRRENFDAVARGYFGAKAGAILGELTGLRQGVVSARDKLQAVEETLDTLRGEAALEIHGGLSFKIQPLLEEKGGAFPGRIATERPPLLFGPQGRNQGPLPDPGISQWGPYRYSFFSKNDVTIGVVCEKAHQGRVEQFVEMLRNGYPENLWRGQWANPYAGGLVGKFRLGTIKVVFEPALAPTSQAYKDAVQRLLSRSTPDLGFVQTRTEYRDRSGDQNPYLVSKAAFMTAAVPVQSVEIETIDGKKGALPYILNNVGLASYAKLGGTPWVMAVAAPTTHEIVLGLGYTETGHRGAGSRQRYVAITTVFQGDGRYLVWGRTRAVDFENYATALLENLRDTITYVRHQNNWQIGDRVRLVFHVYRHLKHQEMDAIKEVASELTGAQFDIEYAFVDVSRFHSYHIFDPAQTGKSYGRNRVKGVGVPERGTCLRLGERSALLHLTGPGDLKTDEQGLPQPLLVDLHPESDFEDLPYLVRQIYHFSYMSWRTFFPGTEPVTILYSRSIAQKLASLKSVPGWNSTSVLAGPLRESKWFL